MDPGCPVLPQSSDEGEAGDVQEGPTGGALGGCWEAGGAVRSEQLHGMASWN